MKTTNNVQKTENSQSEKSTMKTLAAVISLVLFGFAANANGFLMYPAVAHSNETIATSNAYLLETSVEKNLEIEDWMNNEKYSGTQTVGIEAEIEESMKVEGWMLTMQNFVETKNDTECDSALEVENWMLDASIWRK